MPSHSLISARRAMCCPPWLEKQKIHTREYSAGGTRPIIPPNFRKLVQASNACCVAADWQNISGASCAVAGQFDELGKAVAGSRLAGLLFAVCAPHSPPPLDEPL